MLTVKKIQAIVQEAKPGYYSHTRGLYLVVNRNGTPSWCLRYMIEGKRRTMTLAAYQPITSRALSDIEARAAEERTKVKDGVDPLDLRHAEKIEQLKQAEINREAAKVETFEDVARDYIAAKRPGWRNPKHADQWANTLQTYAYPVIGKMPPHEIKTEHLRKILNPIWSTKAETASRLRARIQAIISAAKAIGLHDYPERWQNHHNPAEWADNLEHLLPTINRDRNRRNQPAMPYKDAPAFAQRLQDRIDASSKALLFTVLTAARSGETFGATWDEIDLCAGVWIVSGDRMKAGKEHRVPLPRQAIALLRGQYRIDGNPHVFPGRDRGKGLSNMAMLETMRGMNDIGRKYVPHGFRSTFRDWASEETDYPDRVVEMCLAHSIGNKVERAYRRGNLFELRKQLMQEWADYLLGETAAEPENEQFEETII